MKKLFYFEELKILISIHTADQWVDVYDIIRLHGYSKFNKPSLGFFLNENIIIPKDHIFKKILMHGKSDYFMGRESVCFIKLTLRALWLYSLEVKRRKDAGAGTYPAECLVK